MSADKPPDKPPPRDPEFEKAFLELFEELLAFALFLGGSKTEAPTYVAEAFARMREGDRAGTQLRGRELYKQACGAIRSIVGHARTAAYKKREKSAVMFRRDDDGDGDDDAPSSVDAPTALPDAEAVATMKEDATTLYEAAKRAIGDDPTCLGILDLALEGIFDPKTIAEKLGKTVQEINNAQERLRRKCERFVRRPEKTR